ncbi:MAG: hypothetical protein IKT58_02940 [Oscillospiraceae bacterium]|nr:hypothetical protein [Oscillospiraceae bacterium]
MNLKKIILVVVLCVALVVGLVWAKRRSDTKELLPVVPTAEQLYGQWITTVPAAPYIESSIRSGIGLECEIETDLQITYVFEYSKDGIMTMSMDPTSAQEVVDCLKAEIEARLPDALYASLGEKDGMTREEIDATLAVQGKDIPTLVESGLKNIKFDSIIAQETNPLPMYYVLKEDRLYYAGTAETLAEEKFDLRVDPILQGDTLTLSNAIVANGEEFTGSEMVKYPLTLTKR